MDSSEGIKEGIRHGAPQAVQVVDRFHLVQNLRDALERLFLRYRRDLNTLGYFMESTLRLNACIRRSRWRVD